MNPSTVYCDNCGAANRPTARFCTKCGQAMATASSLPPTVQVGAVVSTPSTPPSAQSMPSSTSPSLTGLLPANSLLKGRYLILTRLGQGGMGAVYKASDTHLGDRPVAVKEMSQKGLDPQEVAEAADAFKREAHMLAGLQHPNLPSIHDHFADGGRWYLVMSFIQGETLEEYLATKGGKLPIQEVLDIGIQLATVLSYLHSHQPPIIFRDLKPANVMRTPDGHLYLIDFGIARHFKAGQAKDTAAYGSMGYAPPEQYGKAQTTPQSDIYSLGATLHQLLSGNDPSQSPFRFAPLSGAGIPAGLSTLIAQMLDMDADKRPASMAEVKQELQRISAQPAVSQPPQTPNQLPPTVYVGGSAPSKLDDIFTDAERRMQKAVEARKHDLSSIETGRANASLLDRIHIDYYGTPTPINQIASISVPQARLLVIQPWDRKMLAAIEKALQKSHLGINLNNDGQVIRLTIPPLNEERRRELVTTLHKKLDEHKIAVHNIHRDALEKLRDSEKKKEIAEYELWRRIQDLNKLTNQYFDEMEQVSKAKELEILEV
jgi:ribosome recycling factor